jgi:hypothetical protein
VILAAQFAFVREGDVGADDLLQGIRTLRHTTAQGSTYSKSAGFTGN